jgi:hypothetical protein
MITSGGFCADFFPLVPTELAEQPCGEEEEDYTRVQELQQQLLNDLPSNLKAGLRIHIHFIRIRIWI